MRSTGTRIPLDSTENAPNGHLGSAERRIKDAGVQTANDGRDKVNGYGPDTGFFGDSVRNKVG